MPELRLVEKSDRSPSGCVFCGSQLGPFVDTSVEVIQFWTASGVQSTRTRMYVCVGSTENPGCAVQIGRRTGLMVDKSKMEEMQKYVEDLHSEIASLQATVAQKTVKIGEVGEWLQAQIPAGAVASSGGVYD